MKDTEKHDGNVYNSDNVIAVPVLELIMEKSGQFKVKRLESEADYSLPFTANIRKAWRPTSVHMSIVQCIRLARDFCEVATLPVHNGMQENLVSQVHHSNLLYSQGNVQYFVYCWWEN